MFEKMDPILETWGLTFTVVLIAIGNYSEFYFIAFFFVMYQLTILVSSFSILYDQISFNNYKDKKDLNLFILTILIEPLVVHPKSYGGD